MKELTSISTIDEQLVKSLQRKDVKSLAVVTFKLPQIYYKNQFRFFRSQDFQDTWADLLASLDTEKIEYILDRLQIHQISLSLDNASKIRQYYVSLINKMLYCQAVDRFRQNKRLVSLNVSLSSDKTKEFIEVIPDEKSTLIIDEVINRDNQKRLKTKIKYIINDPDNRFKTIHPKKYPQCNLQELTMRRLKDENWQSIAQSIDVPFGTLTAFWHRKGKPILQSVLQEFRED